MERHLKGLSVQRRERSKFDELQIPREGGSICTDPNLRIFADYDQYGSDHPRVGLLGAPPSYGSERPAKTISVRRDTLPFREGDGSRISVRRDALLHWEGKGIPLRTASRSAASPPRGGVDIPSVCRVYGRVLYSSFENPARDKSAQSNTRPDARSRRYDDWQWPDSVCTDMI